MENFEKMKREGNFLKRSKKKVDEIL